MDNCFKAWVSQGLNQQSFQFEWILNSMFKILKNLWEITVAVFSHVFDDYIQVWLLQNIQRVQKGLTVEEGIIPQINSSNQGFHNISMHLARNILKPLQNTGISKLLYFSVRIVFNLATEIRQVKLERRRKFIVLFGQDVLEEFLDNGFSVQISITNDVCSFYVKLAFISFWLLEENFHSWKHFQNNIADKFIFFIVL